MMLLSALWLGSQSAWNGAMILVEVENRMHCVDETTTKKKKNKY